MLMLIVDWGFFKDTLFSMMVIEVEVKEYGCNRRGALEKVIVIDDFVF